MIPIVTDTHLGAKNFHKGMFRMMMSFFEDQFFPYILENNIKDVIHAGDMVHNRNMIDLWINQQIKQRFFKWFEDNDVNLHILVGNHDIYYKTSLDVNYLTENTREFTKIKVYSEQTKIKIGKYTFLMVPWVLNHDGFELKEKADFCIGHFDIAQFKMTKQQYSQEGFAHEFFADFKAVYSGHYHIHSARKNIHMVGCPYQHNWGDYAEEKGFYVIKDNFESEFIDNTSTPRFIKLYYDEIDEEVSISAGGLTGSTRSKKLKGPEYAVALAKNNYCRLITSRVTDQAKLDAFYHSLNTVSKDSYKIEIIDANEIIESYDLGDLEAEIAEEADINHQVATYLSGMTFEKDIDKDLLGKLFQDLYKEASEMATELE